jgi:hypothetical protein
VERKTVQYQAVTEEEAQRQYAADSAEAIAAGWVVESVRWEQASPPMLVVTYTRSGARPSAYQTPVEPKPGRSAGRALYMVFLAALAVTAVIFALVLVMNNGNALDCVFGGC